MLIVWKIGSCCGHGGHVIESICRIRVAEVSGAPVAPFSLKALDALIADPHEVGELFEAEVRSSVVLVVD